MTTQTPESARHPTELPADEYAALELSASWPVLSLACFATALASRFLLELLPSEMLGYPYRVLLPALAAPLLAMLGIVCALVGMRHEASRGLARLGLFLNAVTLVLSALLIAAFFYILPG